MDHGHEDDRLLFGLLLALLAIALLIAFAVFVLRRYSITPIA